MISKDSVYSVKNRSASIVVYKIPERNIRREWAPGEIKKITYDELEQLSYQAGGKELMANFLQIIEEEVTEDLGISRQPEYDMSEQQVIELLADGSYEAFLDALDYAPIGVMDLIKKFSVSLPLTDMQKRMALKAKTGFDVDKAIANDRADKEPEGSEQSASVAAPGRRTAVSYKVVNKDK